MRKVCAWCKRPMNDERRIGGLVSHGICDECAEALGIKISALELQTRSVLKFGLLEQLKELKFLRPRHNRW